MSDKIGVAELDEQQAELLPPRTLMQAVSGAGAHPGLDPIVDVLADAYVEVF